MINNSLTTENNQVKAVQFKDVQMIDDIIYSKQNNIALKLTVLKPLETTDKLYPTIMYIHGGSWSYGSRKEYLETLTYFCKSGFVVISIDYRYSSQAIFPAQIIDCTNALIYIEENAEKFNIDPKRIGAFGISAGGFLTALLGTGVESVLSSYNISPALEIPYPLKAVCLWSSPVDLVNDTEAIKQPIEMLMGGTYFEKKDQYTNASPMYNIIESMPAFLIFHGEKDDLIPVASVKAFHNKLIQGKEEAELVIVPNQGHTLSGIEIFEQMDSFFSKWLK